MNALESVYMEVCSITSSKIYFGCQWVFAIKVCYHEQMDHTKGQLVAKVYPQIYGLDYIGTLQKWFMLVFLC